MSDLTERQKPGCEAYRSRDESFFNLFTQPRARRPIP